MLLLGLILLFVPPSQLQESEKYCNCQCNALTWHYIWNEYGQQVSVTTSASGFVYEHFYGQQLHGNCQSGREGGVLWCYVNPQYSNCPDLEESSLFPGQQVSYEACYSPPVTSQECSSLGSAPTPIGSGYNPGFGGSGGGFISIQNKYPSITTAYLNPCRWGEYYSRAFGRCKRRTRGRGRNRRM